jgi:hypothetical protein
MRAETLSKSLVVETIPLSLRLQHHSKCLIFEGSLSTVVRGLCILYMFRPPVTLIVSPFT